MTNEISPNSTPAAVTETNAVPSMDSIAAKMTAMRDQTQRNLLRQQPDEAVTGQEDAAAESSPVAPEGEPEVADTSDTEIVSDNQEDQAQDEPVSEDQTDSTADELIDFIEFAETNPNAKFKFMKNGKEVVIDAKKAAAILGQGSAIHEEVRPSCFDRISLMYSSNSARSILSCLASSCIALP